MYSNDPILCRRGTTGRNLRQDEQKRNCFPVASSGELLAPMSAERRSGQLNVDAMWIVRLRVQVQAEAPDQKSTPSLAAITKK